MAVEETHTREREGGSGGGRSASRPDSPGNWIKKHRALAAVGGGGIILLLVAHKGNSSGASGNTSAQDAAQAAAAEQQAIDSAVAGQAAVAPDTSLSGGDGGGSGGGDGGDGGGGDGSGGGGDNLGSAAGSGGSDNSPPPTQVGPINVETANPNGTGDKHKHHRHPPAGQHHKHQKEVQSKHRKVTDKNDHNKGTASGSHGGHGVDVHGRHFAGARAVLYGPPQMHAYGVDQPITIDHGGYTSAHVSHNNGASWTDHPAGSTPPSRGAPHPVNGTGARIQEPRRVVRPAYHAPPSPPRREPARRGRR